MTSEDRIKRLLRKIDEHTPARSYSDRLLIEIYRQQIEEVCRKRQKDCRRVLLGFSITK